MPPTTVNDRGSSKSAVGHTINEILGLKDQYSSESESSGSSTENSGSDHERSPSPGAGTQQASSAEHQAEGLQHRQGKMPGGINIDGALGACIILLSSILADPIATLQSPLALQTGGQPFSVGEGNTQTALIFALKINVITMPHCYLSSGTGLIILQTTSQDPVLTTAQLASPIPSKRPNSIVVA